jgi:hypothetical protein
MTLFSHRCLCRHAAVARRGKIGNVTKRNGIQYSTVLSYFIIKTAGILGKIWKLMFFLLLLLIPGLKEFSVDIVDTNKTFSLVMIDQVQLQV